jgi:hypothetical protein
VHLAEVIDALRVNVARHEEVREFRPAANSAPRRRPRRLALGLGDAPSVAVTFNREDLSVVDQAIDERGKPAPLVERYLRLEVTERINARGEIQVPLDPAEVERVVDRLLAEGIEGLAVCLINSYANPVHEARIKEIVTRRAPGLPMCISSDVLPEIVSFR